MTGSKRPVTIWPTQEMAQAEADRLGHATVHRPGGHRSLFVVIGNERDLATELAAFRPTPASRVDDLDTARQAGERDRTTDRDLALAVHASRPRGLTDFELGDLMHRQQTSAGKRRLELERDGLVEHTDIKRLAPSGSMATVWRITQAGRDAAAMLHPSITVGGAA